MTVLIDINVIVDYLQNWEPFRESATAVLDGCAKKRCVGYVAGHTIPTIYYILRKEFSAKDRRDLLQTECALSIGASYIITRNTADFTTSSVPAITPEAFLQNEARNIS